MQVKIKYFFNKIIADLRILNPLGRSPLIAKTASIFLVWYFLENRQPLVIRKFSVKTKS